MFFKKYSYFSVIQYLLPHFMDKYLKDTLKLPEHSSGPQFPGPVLHPGSAPNRPTVICPRTAAEFSVCNALPGSHRLGCFSPCPKRLPLAPLSAQGPRIFPSLTVSRPSSALTMSTTWCSTVPSPLSHRLDPLSFDPATPSHHL